MSGKKEESLGSPRYTQQEYRSGEVEKTNTDWLLKKKKKIENEISIWSLRLKLKMEEKIHVRVVMWTRTSGRWYIEDMIDFSP